jgi:hypothetical protein
MMIEVRLRNIPIASMEAAYVRLDDNVLRLVDDTETTLFFYVVPEGLYGTFDRKQAGKIMVNIND